MYICYNEPMSNSTIKYFLYARKSTDVEDKQILSIDAQLAELREFAVREGLNVVAEIGRASCRERG